MYDPYAELVKHTLANGLEIHSIFWDRPWIRMEIVVHSGAREDPLSLPGLAHFVEHVVSQNIPNREFDQVKKFFDECGGRADFGSTNYLSTQYKFVVPADLETFRKALAIFGSMLFQDRIEKNVEREREVILREFNWRYPFIEKLEWAINIHKALFEGHRLKTWNRPIGRPEGFNTVTKADLQNFYDKHYVPGNISLVIIGGLSNKEVIAELKKSPFGIQMDGVRNPFLPPFGQIPIPIEQAKIVKLSDYVNFKVDQTEYNAIWAFPANFPREARRVFSQVLSQILLDEIREKRGLAYSIDNSYTNFQDIGEYEIVCRINPEAISYIDELVRKCISMVAIRRDLFDRKLKSCIQECLMLDLSGSGISNKLAHDLALNHKIITMHDVWDNLHNVTFEQMGEAASFLSPEQQYTFIAYP